MPDAQSTCVSARLCFTEKVTLVWATLGLLSQASAYSPRQPPSTCCLFSSHLYPGFPLRASLSAAPRFHPVDLSAGLPTFTLPPLPNQPSRFYSADRGISLKCKSDAGTPLAKFWSCSTLPPQPPESPHPYLGLQDLTCGALFTEWTLFSQECGLRSGHAGPQVASRGRWVPGRIPPSPLIKEAEARSQRPLL